MRRLVELWNGPAMTSLRRAGELASVKMIAWNQALDRPDRIRLSQRDLLAIVTGVCQNRQAALPRRSLCAPRIDKAQPLKGLKVR